LVGLLFFSSYQQSQWRMADDVVVSPGKQGDRPVFVTSGQGVREVEVGTGDAEDRQDPVVVTGAAAVVTGAAAVVTGAAVVVTGAAVVTGLAVVTGAGVVTGGAVVKAAGVVTGGAAVVMVKGGGLVRGVAVRASGCGEADTLVVLSDWRSETSVVAVRFAMEAMYAGTTLGEIWEGGRSPAVDPWVCG
jgi:hypothetical protein